MITATVPTHELLDLLHALCAQNNDVDHGHDAKADSTLERGKHWSGRMTEYEEVLTFLMSSSGRVSL